MPPLVSHKLAEPDFMPGQEGSESQSLSVKDTVNLIDKVPMNDASRREQVTPPDSERRASIGGSVAGTSGLDDQPKLVPETSDRPLTSGTDQKDEKATWVDEYLKARKQFIWENGIIYVSDEVFTKYRWYAVNCHLYVAWTGASPIKTKSDDQQGSGKDSSNATRVAGRISEFTSTKEVEPTTARTSPTRIRIINQILWEHLRKYCLLDVFNVDHRGPFRTIVSYERKLKQLHKEKEQEYSAYAAEHPDDPAVSKAHVRLPLEWAYHVRHVDDKDTPNAIDTEGYRLRVLIDGLRALMHFMDYDIKDVIDSSRNILIGDIEKLPFAHLWFLFPPGQRIVSKGPHRQVYRVLQVTGGRKSLRPREGDNSTWRKEVSDLSVDCFSLDYDGKQFRPVLKTISIKPYDGVWPVLSLAAYPLDLEGENLASTLVDRGKKFEELTKVKHRRYKGLSVKEWWENYVYYDRHHEVDSDVMIDFDRAYRASEPKIPGPAFDSDAIWRPTQEDEAETRDEEDVDYDDRGLLKLGFSKFVQETDLLEPRTAGDFSRDSWILLPYRVWGYSLLARKWFPLDIELVHEIPPLQEGDTDGFEKLILPGNHKDIVRALVKTHVIAQIKADNAPVLKSSGHEFDVVKGKGKGLVILLHGSPGVGKTSTAECVATHTGRPLFPITCGDLGAATAAEVEKNLDIFFDLARKWNAVLLLDEADVFLSSRGSDMRQNSLVSVFLRALEYYSGILILTTNRVGSFDEAVKSRIHCALYYPPLTRTDTIDVWSMNLDMLEIGKSNTESKGKMRFSRKEIEKFAKRHWKEGNRWNGRQIKNAFQTAVALAEWDQMKNNGGQSEQQPPLLEVRHFETVAQASDHFDRYLEKVRRGDHVRLREAEVRRDDVTLEMLDSPAPQRFKPSKSKGGSKAKYVRSPKPPESEDSSSESDDSNSTSDSSSGDEEQESEVSAEAVKKPKKDGGKGKKRKG